MHRVHGRRSAPIGICTMAYRPRGADDESRARSTCGAVSASSTMPAPVSVSSPRRFVTAPGMDIRVSPACVAAPSAHAIAKGLPVAPCLGAASTMRQGGGHRAPGRRTPCAGSADTVRRSGEYRASGRRIPYVGVANTVRQGGGHRASERRTSYVGAACAMRQSDGRRASERRTLCIGAAGTVPWVASTVRRG